MGSPRGFHTNDGLEVKFTARFRKMYNSKKKKPLDSIRQQKSDTDLKASGRKLVGNLGIFKYPKFSSFFSHHSLETRFLEENIGMPKWLGKIPVCSST